MVEVFKASGVNFPLLCTHMMDMAMKQLHSDGKINSSGLYKDNTHLHLDKAGRGRVNNLAEEICISTRLLSLASDKKYGASKQELKNNLVKGKDNYPVAWHQ